MDTSTWIAAGSLVVAVGSLCVAGVGTYLSHRRATQALEESKKAAAGAFWADAQAAVQRFIGFDPVREPIEDRLVQLRTAQIALVDELEWPGLDAWLEVERALGAALGYQVMAQGKDDDTVDNRLAQLEPLILWAQVLSQNLRHFRKVGPSRDDAIKLHDNAVAHLRQAHERNGREMPPTTHPRIKPLE